jgi:hypothetical protein
MGSGLYAELTRAGLLLPHEEVDAAPPLPQIAHRVLRPEALPFVSYPYEWCFSQLRDAALATLDVQRAALAHGMTLRDASAYNVQFLRGRPVFIDTLSFGRAAEGAPWVGYRQFCQHFLAPLALAARRDIRLLELLRIHLDGIPLDLAVALLPWRAWANVHLLVHLRVHARYQRRYAGDPQGAARARPMTRAAQENLITALAAATGRLRFDPAATPWVDYTEGDSYAAAALEHKRKIVEELLTEIAPGEVWDLGANTGEFSRIAAARGIRCVAFDADFACVEQCYRRGRRDGETLVLPLRLDLTNPSPDQGWAHEERASLAKRASADAVMALALVHHLAIANNVPLARIAAFFARLAPHAIVEFVPKSDPKVAVLLATREDVFPDYTEEGFEAAFRREYEIERKIPVEGSDRVLYRLRRRVTSTA